MAGLVIWGRLIQWYFSFVITDCTQFLVVRMRYHRLIYANDTGYLRPSSEKLGQKVPNTVQCAGWSFQITP